MYMLGGEQSAVKSTLSKHLVARLLGGRTCERELAAAAAPVQGSVALCVGLMAALAQLHDCSAHCCGVVGFRFVVCSLSPVERCKCCAVFVCCWIAAALQQSSAGCAPGFECSACSSDMCCCVRSFLWDASV
jgi:hypothetical protein